MFLAAKYDRGCRAELAEKQLRLIEREKELLDKDQTVSTLREEVSILFNEMQQFTCRAWVRSSFLMYMTQPCILRS